MSFKHHPNNRHKQFLQSSRQELLSLEVPLQTMESDAWTYLLAHGNCAYTGWSIDNLTIQQLTKLLELVEKYGGNYTRLLVERIENRIKKG